VNEALEKLAQIDPRQSRIVELPILRGADRRGDHGRAARMHNYNQNASGDRPKPGCFARWPWERRHDSGTLAAVKTIFDGHWEWRIASRAEFIRGRCRNDEDFRGKWNPCCHPTGRSIPSRKSRNGRGGDGNGGPCRRRLLPTARSEAALILRSLRNEGGLGRGGMSMVYPRPGSELTRSVPRTPAAGRRLSPAGRP